MLITLAELFAKCESNVVLVSSPENDPQARDLLLRIKSTTETVNLTVSDLQKVASQERIKDRARTATVAFSAEEFDKMDGLESIKEAEEAVAQCPVAIIDGSWELSLSAFCSVLIKGLVENTILIFLLQITIRYMTF